MKSIASTLIQFMKVKSAVTERKRYVSVMFVLTSLSIFALSACEPCGILIVSPGLKKKQLL